MASPRTTEPLLTRLLAGEVDHEAVGDQLERILASAVFRNSKRCSSLLRHVVEQVLDGRPDNLKERNIGVDVFGRPADYDTNVDHVVRSVAGEVRRRLAQYYMEPGHEGELRIDLLAGSYVPQFGQTPLPAVTVLPPVPKQFPSAWVAVAAGAIVAVLAIVAVVRLWVPARPFDQFWKPFLSSSNMALLCAGGGGQPAALTGPDGPLKVGEFERQPFRRMHTSDAVALASLAAMLQSSGKPYRILNRAAGTSFRDLQSGPFILIGAMNNEWTLRFTSGLRFGFEHLPNGARVVDRQNPSEQSWRVDVTAPITQFNRDYAIVSRIRDGQTEQPVIIVAGILSWGTLAAAEFVTNPEHLRKLEKLAPRRWEQKNVQVVIGTDVIRGSSGPPIVLAAHFW